MLNEAILFIIAVINIIFVFLLARFDAKWIYTSIVLNLLLVSIFGAKIIEVFGFNTNVGNVFYACVFLATYLLIEKGQKSTQTILFGSLSVVAFVILSKFVILLNGISDNQDISEAMKTLFTASPRIAVASILAYIFAQYVNISIYKWIKEKTGDKLLWLRANIANILSQFVDSTLFFTIAFLDISGKNLLEAILLGWLIKVFTVLIATPFLYINRYLDKEKKI